MVESWDVRQPELAYDETDDITYAAVGRVLTQWEYLEAQLARLYAGCKGAPLSFDLFREYGEGTIFQTRQAALVAAAETYFCRNPSQALEAEFDSLMDQCVMFAQRRNQIAHGTVRPTRYAVKDQLDPLLGPVQFEGFDFCLLPAHYDPRRHSTDDEPEFAYTSVEMRDIEHGIFRLSQRIGAYLRKVFVETSLPPVIRP
jgi:hypothetical protein